ncbi:MAG TPA: hypothetical protein VHI54_12375 [Actinomycetota bacterium]|nr:hypothetical protein [Actinomycetota bacterium]
MANVEYVVAGYVVTALALGLYVLRLHQRARAAARRTKAIAGKRDR